MKVLLDINVLLDVVLDRQPWVVEALALSRACAAGKLDGWMSAVTPPTLFYIVRKAAGFPKAHEAVKLCLESFQVLAVDRHVLQLARTLAGIDYEDNVQIACVMSGQLDALVSRDRQVRAGAEVPVLTPAELLARLGP